VIRDVAARTAVGGYPAVAVRQWHRQTVAVTRLARPKAHSIAKDALESFVVSKESADSEGRDYAAAVTPLSS
jgi:hypothetical protein